MSWEIKKLSDCCVSIADGDHQAPPKADSGLPFVTISNINATNQFDFTDTMFVPQEYYDRLDSKRKAQKGDVLYSVVGSFGIPVYMKETIPFVFQRHIAILRPNESILPQFMYYTMLSRDFYMMADAAALGAAQRTVSLTALRNMKIAVPPLNIQAKIVEVLSAYDDLIENNQKQIKLLEEAAQRLYKEWFVDLRFPGYETTPVVDGVPEGWGYAAVTDMLEIKYGKDHKALEDGKIPVYGSGGIMRKVNKILYSGESVLIPRKGSLNNILLVSGDFWTIDTMFFSVPKHPNTAKYVYLFLKSVDMYAMNIGAAVPSMTVKILNGIKLLCPVPEILNQFEKMTESYFSMIESLKKQNESLSSARNLLLHKLMNGEIEV